MPDRTELLDADLLEALRTALGDTPVIHTLAHGKPNWIGEISREGVLVETEKSRKEGEDAQLVPAWMLNEAWRHLKLHGSLTNDHLLHVLNVKRSSAVCALLAQLPGVQARTGRGITLQLVR